MTVAGLEATLRLFMNREFLNQAHPTYRMFSLTVDELDERARPIADRLAGALVGKAEVAVINGASQVGSGSVPTETIPSRLLSIRPKSISADALARKLRYYSPPIFARIHQEAVLFDLRTIQPGEDAQVEEALTRILTLA
jgi:L-seryl-tRNA(Ser) seleniumtransferase